MTAPESVVRAVEESRIEHSSFTAGNDDRTIVCACGQQFAAPRARARRVAWAHHSMKATADAAVTAYLASPEHAAMLRAERAEALREAASKALVDRRTGWRWVDEAVSDWLRSRADRIEGGDDA